MRLIVRIDGPTLPVAKLVREQGCRAMVTQLLARAPQQLGFSFTPDFEERCAAAGNDLRRFWSTVTDLGLMVNLVSQAGAPAREVAYALVRMFGELEHEYCESDAGRKACAAIAEALRGHVPGKVFGLPYAVDAPNVYEACFVMASYEATSAVIGATCSDPSCRATPATHDELAYDHVSQAIEGLRMCGRARDEARGISDARAHTQRWARAFERQWPVELFEVNAWPEGGSAC